MTSQRLSFDLGAEDARIFLDECREEIDRIESGLLELERDPSAAAVVNDVFRAAHTLKGSAATIGHRRMAELTHAMEDVFGALRSGRLDDLAPLAEPLLATIDVLRALVEEVTAGEALTDAPEALTAELFLDSGTRGCGLGQLAFGCEDPQSGEIHYSPLEVVRLAIPRRVYTDNHIRHVARSVIDIYARRQAIKGMRLVWAPPGLRHFTAHLEPLA